MHKHCAAKNYNATTDEKLQRGIWPGSGEKKLQRDNGQLAKAKTNYNAALAAGWMAELSRCNLFFGRKLQRCKIWSGT